MNEQGLKALENLGAELGAAKSENEKLRGLLTTLRVSLNLDDTEYGLSRQEKRSLAAEIDAALSRQAEPCGGCGNADASKRCIGCGHRFEKPVAMCETMQRPKAECGCPDCGPSLIDWPTAEPTDTYTAVDMATAAAQGFRDGQAAVEQATAQAKPAPAQDDQYPPCDYCGVIPDHHPWHGSGMFNGEDSPHIHACNDCRHLLPTRPAQTEQQQACDVAPPHWWIDHGSHGQITQRRDEADSARAEGKRVVRYAAAPIAQTAPNSDCEWCAGAGKDHFGEKCEHCQAAPQPEQSGLVEALEEIASGLQAEFAWEVAEQALAAYRAVLSAQGAGDADS